MTLHGTDLMAIVAVVVIAFTVSYALLLNRLKAMIAERQLKLEDQLAGLDAAIRALETRLAHQAQQSRAELHSSVASMEEPQAGTSADEMDAESGEIAPEIQAAIAAAAVAALGPGAVVQAVKPVPSPWSQQGRVMVQGGHNLRLRR